MEKLVIEGGRVLNGAITASGAKNSALPIIVASALAEEESLLENVPHGTDVEIICDILSSLGVKVRWDGPGRLRVNGAGLSQTRAPYELVRKMRASFMWQGCFRSAGRSSGAATGRLLYWLTTGGLSY